jgi:hypothetical protein
MSASQLDYMPEKLELGKMPMENYVVMVTGKAK